MCIGKTGSSAAPGHSVTALLDTHSTLIPIIKHRTVKLVEVLLCRVACAEAALSPYMISEVDMPS